MRNETRPAPARAQNIILENRSRLSVTGVEDVANFDEETVAVHTALGELLIRGKELHVEALSLESGDLTVTGTVSELSYVEHTRGGSVWERLFG